MAALWQDVRYGFRMLCKNPGFTAIALITLAIGIGANAIMFSISDLLLLRPMKVKAPERLAFCGIKDARFSWFRYSGYLTLRDSDLAFSDVMAQDIGVGESATLVHHDSVWDVRPTYVSANYFAALGAPPVLGRSFVPEEERHGGAHVAVLSHRCWQRLGSEKELVGEFLRVNGIRCQVVGIAPAGFTGVELIGPDLWLPLGSYRALSVPPGEKGRDYPFLEVIGRLKPGVTMSIAQAQLQTLAPHFQREDPFNWKNHSSFDPRPLGRFAVAGDADKTRVVVSVFSLVLMGASAIILVIACLNIASMLIVQGTSRHREIAVRMALGGGRRRIVRQLLIESGLLALLGGVLGVVLAFWGMWILNVSVAAAQQWTRDLRLGLNVRVLVATLGFCLIAVPLFGLRPALWLSKRDIAGEMKASATSVLGTLRRRRGAFSVAGQIALAVALVLSAVLLTRSALQMARPNPRFPLDDKLIVQIDPDSTGYDRTRNIQICAALADRLASLPDVQAVGTSQRALFDGDGHASIREHQGDAEESGSRRPLVREGAIRFIGRDYFTALEIPLLQGRFFDLRDHGPNAERVTIIDESLARKLRPDGHALGCLIQWGIYGEYQDSHRVIGIVANMPDVGERELCARMYQPIGSDGLFPCFYLHAVNRGSVDALRRRIAEEVHLVDAQIPILSVATLAEKRDANSSIWLARFGARIGLAAGAAALFLAALGIYAIKGYRVASRTSEIGIRMALGATHGSVVGMVLREDLALTIMGLCTGLVLGLGVAKVAARFLYGVSPADPVSIAVTVALLGAAALLAGYLPARRAAKVDPMTALRCE